MISEETAGPDGGSLIATYVHNPQVPIGTILGRRDSSGNYTYYHQDHIGSTRYLTNESKASAQAVEYVPFGGVLSRSGSATNNYLFTGKELDADTSFYYFPYRYYSPQMARWLTRDPVGTLMLLRMRAPRPGEAVKR